MEKMCHFCGKSTSFTENKSFAMCGSHLIIQLMRFRQKPNGTVDKDTDPVAISKSLSIPITSHDGSVSEKEFILKGFINHLGTLNNGHYTATVLDRKGSGWLHCDDRVVSPYGDNKEEFFSPYVYLLFYEQLR